MRRGLQGQERQALERYQESLARGEQQQLGGGQGMRREREGEGERRTYGYEAPRR